jgi:hypothetical protein
MVCKIHALSKDFLDFLGRCRTIDAHARKRHIPVVPDKVCRRKRRFSTPFSFGFYHFRLGKVWEGENTVKLPKF